MSLFDLDTKKKTIKELDDQTMDPNFWSDQKKAQKVIRQKNSLSHIVETYASLLEEFQSLDETADALKQDFDAELMEMAEEEYQEASHTFEDFEIEVLLSHEYDQNNAILEIHPGAGGTESCDWASMLYRMYTRYAEKHGFKVKVLEIGRAHV